MVRLLGKTNKKIKKLILVAPAISHGDYGGYLGNLLKFEINKKIAKNIGEIIIFVSDDERESIKKSVEIFSNAFEIKPIGLKGKGHFTERSMGTKKFPELLEKVLE